ncbi:hypothetical protein AWM75_06225 [Aerococcus urinaehominis]|uniref:Uncharacterized protein n=1 Tax=Aerococcus urinaehominis TaxID=128944 RepID=A0A0X8FLN7_9LACT|nr:hypothetical protein [Aerococcus urinaehominis]AMB99601.1 hypothetical protein AWM75_06225 [Aerococcus urinaehominis]SDL87029.1 energy-coupling factor transport system substrate-specific component [Aerococcus urinaehominis]
MVKSIFTMISGYRTWYAKLTKVQRLSILAFWSALAIVGRAFMSALPNIQPVTDMVILAALMFSSYAGLAVAFLVMLTSNIFMGMGPWLLGQVLAYAMVVLLVKALASYWPRRHLNLFFIYFLAVSSAYLYGFVVSLVSYWQLGAKIPFWPYYLAGLSFDSFHALGNFLIMLVLIPTMQRLGQQLFN